MSHYIYAIGSICGIISFLMFDILYLRLLYLIASILFLVSGLLFHNHSMVAWNAGYILINSAQLIYLILSKRPTLLPNYLKSIYPLFSPYLRTRQFKKVCSLADIIEVKPGEKLINANKMIDHLYLIIDGTLNISLNKKHIASLDRGQYIGEMSYITNRLPNADVTAVTASTVLAWSRESLDKLKKEKNTLYMCFRLSISACISRKLEESSILLSRTI